MRLAEARDRLAGNALAVLSSGRSPRRNVALPPRRLRAGGAHFETDEAFLASAVAEAEWLAGHGLLGADRHVLDFGCGAGRLAIGLLEAGAPLAGYVGVDVKSSVVAWARRHIERHFPSFEFVHVDVHNSRYNPWGRPFETARLPVPDGHADVAYAYSVFSHLDIADSTTALRQLRRAVSAGASLVATVFVEDDVDPVTENPPGYGTLRWKGPLHCVRYQRATFEAIAADAGFSVRLLDHSTETDGQSRYLFVAE